jgi:hypothetical protein
LSISVHYLEAVRDAANLTKATLHSVWGSGLRWVAELTGECYVPDEGRGGFALVMGVNRLELVKAFSYCVQI